MTDAATAPARPISGDQRLEMILSCAEQLFHRRGFNGVSIRDLAGAVDVKMSSLYYYFQSKEEILYRIIKRHLEHILAFTEGALAPIPADDHTGRLRTLIYSSVVCMIEDRAASSLAGTEVRHLSGEQRHELIQMIRDFQERFVTAIAAGMESGSFVQADPKITTFAVIGSIARVSAWYRDGGKYTPAEIALMYSEQLTRSVLPR